MNIGIVTAYHNRPEEIKEQISSIAKSLKRSAMQGHKVTHYILDDGSDPILDEKLLNSKYTVKLFRQDPNLGREGYWKTTHNLFQLAKGKGHQLIIHLDDDVKVCRSFFEIVLKLWIKAGPWAMLNLFLDIRAFHRFRSMPPQIIDGMCLIPARLMDLIEWTVEPQPAGRSSTGVWRQLSQRLLAAHPDARVHYLNKSVTFHMGSGAGNSKLNPADRAIVPMETENWAGSSEKVELVDPILGYGRSAVRDEKWVITVSEGMGNCIIPFWLYLRALAINPNVDIYCDGIAAEFYDVLCGYYGNECHREIDPNDYDQVIYAHRQTMRQIPGDHARVAALCNKWGLNADMNGSAYREVTPLNWPELRGEAYMPQKYDVVICAGSLNVDGKWMRKRYQRWVEVAHILRDAGFTVASVGKNEDYIHGTVDKTGLPLVFSFDIVDACDVFASNCTGPAHFREACGKRHIVAVTASNIKKNWEPKHNRFTSIVKGDCEPCQEVTGKMGNRWRECVTWDCCYFDPQLIVESVYSILGEI